MRSTTRPCWCSSGSSLSPMPRIVTSCPCGPMGSTDSAVSSRFARDLSVEAERHNSLDEIEFDQNATDLWDNVRALWTAVDKGRKDWNVPSYNGGMFSSDPAVDPTGSALVGMEFTNAEFGPALAGLLVDETIDGKIGPVDFASLDVREFGTIYEGLLESNLAVATVALISKEDTWIPASPQDEIEVEEGAVYLHNKSGARKASGSYFTKPFAVNHLLDHALEPALDNHIARLTRLVGDGDEVGAAEAFFDFRCADLAMGSGHFLVAAVDRIERRLSEFLVDHRIGGVHDELDRLRAAAEQNLADAGIPADGADTNALLRRQIARRCIYGVDLNSTAVELARLALWLHTFVRGLPLTSLNHGLVRGNSLTGIATLDEAVNVLDPDRGVGAASFVLLAVTEALEGARTALKRFADTSEATAAEVSEARKAHDEAERAIAPATLLFDLAVAVRLGAAPVPATAFDVAALTQAAGRSPSKGRLRQPRQRCTSPCPSRRSLSGNGQGSTAYWVTRRGKRRLSKSWRSGQDTSPDMRSKPLVERKRMMERFRVQRLDLYEEYERELASEARVRAALIAGPFPGMGTGDPDLYKAFTWRFWSLIRQDGRVGVVLPRQALAAAGSGPWRREVLWHGQFDLTMLLQLPRWVFDDADTAIHHRPLVIVKGDQDAGLAFAARPVREPVQYQRWAGNRIGAVVDAVELASWTEHASVPLVPSARHSVCSSSCGPSRG